MTRRFIDNYGFTELSMIIFLVWPELRRLKSLVFGVQYVSNFSCKYFSGKLK